MTAGTYPSTLPSSVSAAPTEADAPTLAGRVPTSERSEPAGVSTVLSDREERAIVSKWRPHTRLPQSTWRWPLRIATVVAALALWQWLATADIVLWLHFDTIPSPTEVASAWWTRLHTGEYYLDLGQSLIRIGVGFVLATSVGIPLGIALGRSAVAGDTLGTLTELARPIPAIALVPIAILIFPTDEAGMVFITFVAALFPIVVSTRHAVRALPTIWEESVRTMGGTRRDVVLRVILPGIMPGVFGGLSVGIGVAWICLISAEMISGRLGVGYRTWQSYTVVDYPGVFVGMFTIAALGVLTSGAIELVGRRVTSWLPRGQERSL